MRKTFLVLGLMGTLSLGSVYAQEFHLQPTPQEYQAGQDSVMVPVNIVSRLRLLFVKLLLFIC